MFEQQPTEPPPEIFAAIANEQPVARDGVVGTCKTCVLWNRDGYCWCSKFKYGEGPLRDGLSYSDSEMCDGNILTGPDFGCIHHTAK